MPKIVAIPGLGHAAFPETMPDHEIAGHIAEHLKLPREDRIRGSADLPLTRDGQAKAAELGKQLAPYGGFDRIAASPKKRTMDTAKLISPHAFIKMDPNLEDMNYGELEGQKSADAIPLINDYIKNRPHERLPGVSKFSGKAGESFNEYKSRLLPEIHRVIEIARQHPGEKIALVLNRRSIKTMLAWMTKGRPKSLATDTAIATSFQHDDIPNGSIQRWTPKGLEPIKHVSDITPGLYVMRHFATHWNS